MSSFPPHLAPVTRVRRFCAGLLNYISAAFVAALAGAATGDARERIGAIGFLAALWLLCILKKKSLGAMFCLLEIRRPDGRPPSFQQMIGRSGPIFILAVLWCIPTEILPQWMILIRPPTLLTFVCLALASGITGLVSGSSILDRLSKTVVLQLKLPQGASFRIE